MKKIVIIITATILTATVAIAATTCRMDEDRPINFNELPTVAQEFIRTHFANSQVSHTLIDRDITDTEYKVVLADGTKVEFNGSGQWREVDCRYTAVPEAIVPDAIEQYIAANYPNSQIVEIKSGRNGWEAKITGGLELTFNNDMQLVDIDD